MPLDYFSNPRKPGKCAKSYPRVVPDDHHLSSNSEMNGETYSAEFRIAQRLLFYSEKSSKRVLKRRKKTQMLLRTLLNS
jgi:hypothetical protein